MVEPATLHLDWLAVDGVATAGRLAALLGAAVAPGERVILHGGSLSVVHAPGAREDRLDRLRIEIDGPPETGGPSGTGELPATRDPYATGELPATREPYTTGEPALLAVGWATVELDRAEVEVATLAEAVTGRAPAAATLPDDPLLGARARALWLAEDGPAIVLLEPATEGRLAASLARHGEGPVAIYLARPGGAPVRRTKRALPCGTSLGREAIGPFGRSQALVAGGRPWGPHLVVITGPLAPSREDLETAGSAPAPGRRIEEGAGTIEA